jgi:pyruvate/oxaloacetate carboxyltransferase
MTFFIDRPETDKFLSKLAEGLKDPANNPLVLHSWGIGGVGKTTLLAKIVEQHPAAAISKVSFGSTSDIETPIKLMKKLHEQLYPNLNDWEENEDEFTSRHNEYQITLSKLEKDKDAKEFGKILQSSAQGILVTEKVASEVTKQGFQALMESTGVTDKLNAWLNRSSVTKGNVELLVVQKTPETVTGRRKW